MKRIIALCAVFLSLDLYGCQGGIDRIFSPEPEQESLRVDLAHVLKRKLDQNPVLAKKLKEDFKVTFEHYHASFKPSAVAVETEADGTRRPALECPYSEYKKFIYFSLSQLLQLGYGVRDIYGVDGHAIHDNRQNLLWCWLEVNLLSKYENRFFEQKSEYEEALYVKSLFRAVLPGFCFILSGIIRDGAEIRVVDGKMFRLFGDGTVEILCA